MTEPGKYLVLEGGDGVGKSDQAKLLVEWLGSRDRPARHLREPGSTACANPCAASSCPLIPATCRR